ncbi:hypothetical protein JCM1841_002634 [Sporobolomyces salmonicolor]
MSYSAAQFDKAVEIIGALPKDGPVQPSQEDKLVFYALYKQATVGDNTTPKPGMMDFAGRYKWTAWDKVKGKSQDEAKSEYVLHFFKVLEKDTTGEGAKHKAAVEAAA